MKEESNRNIYIFTIFGFEYVYKIYNVGERFYILK